MPFFRSRDSSRVAAFAAELPGNIFPPASVHSPQRPTCRPFAAPLRYASRCIAACQLYRSENPLMSAENGSGRFKFVSLP